MVGPTGRTQCSAASDSRDRDDPTYRAVRVPGRRHGSRIHRHRPRTAAITWNRRPCRRTARSSSTRSGNPDIKRSTHGVVDIDGGQARRNWHSMAPTSGDWRDATLVARRRRNSCSIGTTERRIRASGRRARRTAGTSRASGAASRHYRAAISAEFSPDGSLSSPATDGTVRRGSCPSADRPWRSAFPTPTSSGRWQRLPL